MICKCAKCGKEAEIVCFVDDEPWCEECLDKALGTPPKHITNYDRLISKSPEELARWIWAVQSEIKHEDLFSTDGWYVWLMQEAEEGE